MASDGSTAPTAITFAGVMPPSLVVRNFSLEGVELSMMLSALRACRSESMGKEFSRGDDYAVKRHNSIGDFIAAVKSKHLVPHLL